MGVRQAFRKVARPTREMVPDTFSFHPSVKRFMARKNKNKHKNQIKSENVSESSVDGQQQEHSVKGENKISAHQPREGNAVKAVVPHPSSSEYHWHKEQKDYWERQIGISKWLNWITGIGGVIAIGALIILYGQFEVMKTSLRTTERAWVTVFQGKLDNIISIGVRPSDTVEIQNSGHSPARNISIKHGLFIWKNLPDGPITSVELAEDKGRPVLGPSVHMGMTSENPVRITEEKMASLKNGSERLFSIGVVLYTDAFEETHRTEFCFFVRDINKVEMSPCIKWNETN